MYMYVYTVTEAYFLCVLFYKIELVSLEFFTCPL